MRSLLILPLAAIAGCSQSAPEPAARQPPPPFTAGALYASLAEEAEGITFTAEGEWGENFGDAPFYGLGFYSRAARGSTHEAAWLARAASARSFERALIDRRDIAGGDLQQEVMAALGLIEYLDATGDRADLEVIDLFMDRLDSLIGALGFYLPERLGQTQSWALQTYGSTSISALVGLLNAQYALIVGGARAEARTEWAQQMAEHIAAAAWSGSYYRFGAEGHEEPSLYPNVAMMALHARLYQLTRDEAQRARALDLFKAIAPLKLPDGRYYSEYSAAAFGATSRDFSTLSSQNYLILALYLLYEITGEAAYVVEADRLLDVLGSKLHGSWCLSQVHAERCAPSCAAPSVCVISACEPDRCQGGILHHWIDGRPALPDDATYYCSGCNLQLLYLMWYRQSQLERVR